MNWEALDTGIFNMSVRLAFEHEGHEFLLTRHVQANRRPIRDSDLEKLVTLEIDGSVQPTERVKDIINGILHEDISRFFLFDGEMLSEYEDLLNDPDRAPTLVRKSIEQILGLPALERTARDLEDLRTQAERRQLQETRRNKQNEKLIRDAQQKEDELAAVDRDLRENALMKQRLEEKRAALRADRDRFLEIQSEVRILDELEDRLHEVDGNISSLQRRSRDLIQNAWWMPLESRIEAEIEALQSREKHSEGQVPESVRIQGRLEAIERILAGEPCVTCSQPVGPEAKANLGRELDELRGALQDAGERERESKANRETLLLLHPFVGRRALAELFDLETELRRHRLQKGRLQRRAAEIKQRVRDHERTEIQRLEREYDECVTQIKDVARRLESGELQRASIHTMLERLRQTIHGLPEADKKVAAEAIILGALENMFQAGIETFRDEVRQDVEVEATRVHQGLTSEQGYDRLRITPQYGLVLVNNEGRTIQQRSAGSEQVLALALIGALNRCATREAPVVMDTPFGRLDKGHRANILKFAPSFGPQVVLLVQSGEFDRTRDMEYLAGKVSSELRLRRDGASDRSIIEPVREF
jgi:DNA sulfur modification protein DndD